MAVDRKPSKQNRPVDWPEMLRAVMAAQGPGMAQTVMPAAVHCLTRSSPGSEMAGLPASETRAQVSPDKILSRIFSPLKDLLCS